MRSLFRSNKSQTSIDRFTNSRDGSPTHSEAPAYPASTAPLTPRNPGGAQYDGASESPEIRRYHDFDQGLSHPAHQLSRSQSHRVGSGSDAHTPARPSVQIIGPSSPDTVHEEERTYPAPPSSQLQPVAPEKEHRKAKRSIFSLHSSSKEPKETSPTSNTQAKFPVRAGSLLRKAGPGQQGPVPASPSPYNQGEGGNAYLNRSQENFSSSGEQSNLPEPEERSSQQEHYYRGHTQYDPSHIQANPHPPAQYPAELQRQNQQQQQQHYPDGQQDLLQEPGETYIAYQQHQQQQEEDAGLYDPRYIRPPSQLSAGPPSPGTQSIDSRPSSATNHSRLSAQSIVAPQQPQHLAQPQQQQVAMARGDPPNLLRDMMSQNRDPRPQEPGHGQYTSQQDSKTRASQHPSEQGRSTPPPRSREDISNMDFQTLLQRHEELQNKYNKVKRYYFEKDTQVTQLQNLIANQRLSMSKTMFDDHQYGSRFERLNGAIRDLSFNIRKEWKGIPPWLAHVVNRDAHTVGMKEMTAVGRACITCWLMDELFNRFFHPDLETCLSSQLKLIEKSLRRSGSTTITSDEQREDLTTKLIAWRLATIEGLAEHLGSPQAGEHRARLVHVLSERLTAALKVYLPEVTPSGLESGVGIIIELAISIAQCLPHESRDICIEYFMPGAPINETYMKMEAQPAQLLNPGANQPPPQADFADQADRATSAGEDAGSAPENGSREAQLENDIREASAKAATSATAGQQRNDSVSGSMTTSKDSKGKKSSFLGGLVNKKPAPPGTSASAGTGITKDEAGTGPESNEGKIRMATFFAVEVRGKAGPAKEGGGGSSIGDKPVVLVRAPVFGYT